MGKYYKVLNKDGKSTHSGFDYTPYLPKNGSAGDWLPEIEELEMCSKGYHITKYWNQWTDVFNKNSRIYEVEFKGKQPIIEHFGVEEKVVCKTIRLLKDVTAELSPAFLLSDNSGNRNSGDFNSGFFCTGEPKVVIFNKETDVKRDDIDFPHWIYVDSIDSQSWRKAFDKADIDDVAKTLKLPNFDYEIFEEIMGFQKRILTQN